MADVAFSNHYDSAGLSGRLMTALAASGLTGRSLTPGDLAPLDQFHTRGMAATMELMSAAGITAADTVLDVGSGLGGPSRTLAATVGCRVVGVDITPSFVEAATMLSSLCGLADQTTYQCGDALSLPFPDASFDVAWSQHVAMNIEDRPRFYGEIRRVLKPGGRLPSTTWLPGRASGCISRCPGPPVRLTAFCWMLKPCVAVWSNKAFACFNGSTGRKKAWFGCNSSDSHELESTQHRTP